MSMIQARFEGGVFRPAQVVDLPDQCDVDLEIHVRNKPPPEVTSAGLELNASSLEARIAVLAAQVPPEEWGRLPNDLSDQLDHYVYGSPKQ